MSAPDRIDHDPLAKLERVLREQGVVAMLRILNARAPHRFTGIYRYEPTILRNVHLVDAFDPALERGDDVALEDAYCVLLAEGRTSIAFGDVVDAPCAPRLASPVMSYCGVLLVTAAGAPFGSLCHFDVKRCERADSEIHLLEAVAPMIMSALESRG